MAKIPKLNSVSRITNRQKKGVANLLSGDYPTKKAALMDAGYTSKGSVSRNPATFMRQKGVQKYVKLLDKESRRVFNGQGIEKKVIEVYVDGLQATKLFGKNAVKHPDFLARKAYADRISPMVGIEGGDKGGGDQNQYNFFMFSNQEKNDFNKDFAKFVKDRVRPSGT